MKNAIEKWTGFAGDVVKDERIPSRSKGIAAALLAWLILPFDLIPDFIPILGQIDDLLVLVVLLDFLFNEIPMDVLVDHYPGPPVDLLRMRRRTRLLRHVIPDAVIEFLWRKSPEREDVLD
jgi:uncharacterized membrane protein YkvA (DUF1232 family)